MDLRKNSKPLLNPLAPSSTIKPTKTTNSNPEASDPGENKTLKITMKTVKKEKYETTPMRTRSSSKQATDSVTKSSKDQLEVKRTLDKNPRMLEAVQTPVPKTPRNKVLKAVKSSSEPLHNAPFYTPKAPKPPALKVELQTPKSLRKKAPETPKNSSRKKLSNKVISPITKTLQEVTENLIKKNQFQADTPLKSFKIFRSKNEEETKEEQNKTFEEFPMLSPSPKRIVRRRVSLPTQYFGSNVSFDDDPFANEPVLSIERRLAGYERINIEEHRRLQQTLDILIENFNKSKRN